MDILIYIGAAVLISQAFFFILWMFPEWGRTPEELKQHAEEGILNNVKETQQAKRREAYWKGQPPL